MTTTINEVTKYIEDQKKLWYLVFKKYSKTKNLSWYRCIKFIKIYSFILNKNWNLKKIWYKKFYY